jgi:hypothetical protein
MAGVPRWVAVAFIQLVSAAGFLFFQFVVGVHVPYWFRVAFKFGFLATFLMAIGLWFHDRYIEAKEKISHRV